MSRDFQGLIAVISGAGSGIGLAVAKKFSAQGAKVFGLDLSAGELENDGAGTWIECDIGSDESVKLAFESIASQVSKIDVLINNAGIGAQGGVEVATTDEWNKVLNINVIGTSRVSAAALPLMRQSTDAAIVNTCSVVATVGLPNRAIYSASKGAILSLTLAMAADLLKEKIRVNCVNPGTADTPWVGRLLSQAADPVKERAALEARQPIGRLVSPDEVANAIIYLAHPEQKSTTGTVLAVDGGLHSLNVPK
jgi:NAD(P)-dependent dehydrogenase (short-subunit alcohol dehydrogenase family)